jgi:RNA polymerase sigma-70 factor (ECF subfamily)
MSPPAPTATDAQLVARTRQGDAQAFEQLVRRHYRAAFAVAYAVLGERMDAEDACQDAFVRALDRLDDCREPGRFAGWLLQIVRNRARNARDARRLRSTSTLDDAIAAGGSERPDRGAERAELRERLGAALAHLSETQREVLLLHDLEGWRHAEIAAVVGCSEVMSRQHLFVARRTVRGLLAVYAGDAEAKDDG